MSLRDTRLKVDWDGAEIEAVIGRGGYAIVYPVRLCLAYKC